MQIFFVAETWSIMLIASLFSVVAVYGKNEDVSALARRLFLYVRP